MKGIDSVPMTTLVTPDLYITLLGITAVWLVVRSLAATWARARRVRVPVRLIRPHR
jgi:hypothetical protein